MLGPKETGFLYVRKDMLDVVQPKTVGAYSGNGFDLEKRTFDFTPSAQRYEYGTVSIPLRFGLGAAIRFLQKIGMENVWKRDQSLSTRLFTGLKSIPYVTVLSPESKTERSALVTFKHEKVPYGDLQRHLDTYKLRTRGVGEGGVNALRISTHLYNMPEEVDRALEAIKSAYKG
jgi:selenocysteine lyase/cysteine desulfurase